MAEFIGDRTTGLLFPGVAGRPLAQSKILVRYLHPICEKLGIPQQGFHSFRRARLTWLRNNSVPWDIEKFWIGHGDKDITDRYSKLSMDTVLRKQTAERIGTGFVVPVLKSDADSVVYKVRKSAQAAKKEDAA